MSSIAIFRSLCLVGLLIPCPSLLFGQDSGESIVNSLKPVLDSQSVAILHVDLERFRLSDLVEKVINGRNDDASIENQTLTDFTAKHQKRWSDCYELGATDVNFVFKIGTLVPENRMIVFRCKNNEAATNVANRLKQIGYGLSADASGTLALLGDRQWIKQITNPPRWLVLHKDDALTCFKNALDNGKNAPLRFAFALSKDQKRALVELAPATFAAGKAGSPASIENMEWLSASFDQQASDLRLTLQTGNSESTNAIASKIVKSFEAISDLPQMKIQFPQLAAWLTPTTIGIRNDKTIEIHLKDKNLDAFFAAISGPILQVEKSRRAKSSISRLQKIMVAMHNFHDANNHLPAIASQDETGKPLLSWRVHILPFSDEGSELYNQFKLDEPWDSPHNIKLIPRVPSIYRMNNSKAGPGMTRFVAPQGKESPISNPGVGLRDIPDGTSRTIAVMEANSESAVIWTKPDDFGFDQEDLISRLVEKGNKGFWSGLCDASVQFVPREIDSQALKKAFDVNDGESDKLPGITIPLSQGSILPGITPDPTYNPLDEMPEFWLQELIPAFGIISGLSGG